LFSKLITNTCPTGGGPGRGAAPADELAASSIPTHTRASATHRHGATTNLTEVMKENLPSPSIAEVDPG